MTTEEIRKRVYDLLEKREELHILTVDELMVGIKVDENFDIEEFITGLDFYLENGECRMFPTPPNRED